MEIVEDVAHITCRGRGEQHRAWDSRSTEVQEIARERTTQIPGKWSCSATRESTLSKGAISQGERPRQGICLGEQAR